MRAVDMQRSAENRQFRWLRLAKLIAAAWAVNFLLFFVGYAIVWSSGKPVSREDRSLPWVEMQGGSYRQLSRPAFTYLRVHKMVFGALTVLVFPAGLYYRYSKFTFGRRGESRGTM